MAIENPVLYYKVTAPLCYWIENEPWYSGLMSTPKLKCGKDLLSVPEREFLCLLRNLSSSLAANGFS